VRGPEKLDFFTDKSLVDDPYDYYDAIRRCPVWREPAHGVVMVSGYDEAVAVQRDADQTLSVCNIVSGPWSGIPIETASDDISDLIERHRQRVTFSRLEGDRSGFVGVKEEWFVKYIEDRRREPRDDVLTELALATFPDGTTPDAIDVARVATFMFAAGHGTTIDLLSLSMLMLAERPDLQEQLREDNSKIPVFIEEMLRFESPIKSNFRMARRTTRIGDVDVQAGTSVLVMNGAANRDPRRFDEPNEFRLGRPNILQHIAFGPGVHTCPGAPIARAEVRVSLERILDRMANIRLSEAEHGPTGARRLKWDRTFLFRRLKELHLEFTPVQ
jgi:cytochrome P450